MAKKNTDNKEKKTKKPAVNQNSGSKKTTKGEKTKEVTIEESIIDEPIAQDETFDLADENVEVLKQDINNTEIEPTHIKEEKKEELEEPVSITVEEFNEIAEVVEEEAVVDDSEEKRLTYVETQSPEYEEIPLVPMKRNPKNIFFKIKETIKRKLNFE